MDASTVTQAVPVNGEPSTIAMWLAGLLVAVVAWAALDKIRLLYRTVRRVDALAIRVHDIDGKMEEEK